MRLKETAQIEPASLPATGVVAATAEESIIGAPAAAAPTRTGLRRRRTGSAKRAGAPSGTDLPETAPPWRGSAPDALQLSEDEIAERYCETADDCDLTVCRLRDGTIVCAHCPSAIQGYRVFGRIHEAIHHVWQHAVVERFKVAPDLLLRLSIYALQRTPEQHAVHASSWRVAETMLFDGIWVSTVALGVPILDWSYETMVFAEKAGKSLDCRRYPTREQALAGHALLVDEWSARLRKSLPPAP